MRAVVPKKGNSAMPDFPVASRLERSRKSWSIKEASTSSTVALDILRPVLASTTCTRKGSPHSGSRPPFTVPLFVMALHSASAEVVALPGTGKHPKGVKLSSLGHFIRQSTHLPARFNAHLSQSPATITGLNLVVGGGHVGEQWGISPSLIEYATPGVELASMYLGSPSTRMHLMAFSKPFEPKSGTMPWAHPTRHGHSSSPHKQFVHP
mmetsp:Transcript_80799/g.233656  ORF Transcript_80799/g.233656 Transcript_80799/m.233656 type:complete len:209 (-) Transcript_80799:2241-2867(-)